MQKFTVVTGVAAPLKRSNVDTDQIIPAEFLKRVTKTGFEDALFFSARQDPDFVLNRPEYQGARVLVAGPDFGAEWRFAGCSMCLGMNPDQLAPGERCASTSNRNFEGRQGKGGRTHLVSPLVAAATAVRGTLSSPWDLSADEAGIGGAAAGAGDATATPIHDQVAAELTGQTAGGAS